jgi:hypothetical protein
MWVVYLALDLLVAPYSIAKAQLGKQVLGFSAGKPQWPACSRNGGYSELVGSTQLHGAGLMLF